MAGLHIESTNPPSFSAKAKEVIKPSASADESWLAVDTIDTKAEKTEEKDWLLRHHLRLFSQQKTSSIPHDKIYGSIQEQHQKFLEFYEDSGIDASSKEIAAKQINDEFDNPVQIYRAIQTLLFAKANKLYEFQQVKKKLVSELALKYVASRSDWAEDSENIIKRLVTFSADCFGYGPEANDPPAFVKAITNGDISYQEAIAFLKSANAYLSPTKLCRELSKVEEAKTFLVWGNKSSETLQFENSFFWFKEKKYDVRVLTWNPYTVVIKPKQLPPCRHDVSPHIVMPIYEAAIEQCETMSDLLQLTLRILSDFNPEAHESHGLLRILLQARSRELKNISKNLHLKTEADAKEKKLSVVGQFSW